MRNRGIGRGRMFMGGLLLFAAVISWATALMMSPHGSVSAQGTQHVRTVVAEFIRNNALGNLVLCGLSGWLLFPSRRPRWPARDWSILAIVAVVAGTSIYQLIWLRSIL